MPKRTPRKPPGKPRAQSRRARSIDWGALLRPQALGALLVIFAIVVLLSLLSARKGSVTGSLLAALRFLFGGAVWLLPVLLGMGGLQLVFRDLVDQRVLTTRRIASFGVFTLLFTGILHIITTPAKPLAAAQAGQGGGILGYGLSAGLESVLGMTAALGLLLLAACLVFLAGAGLTWHDLEEGAREAWQVLRDALFPLQGRRRVPFWRLHRAAAERQPAVRPVPTKPKIPSGQKQPAPTKSVQLPSPTRAAKPAKAAADPVAAAPLPEANSPHGWRLPVTTDILEESNDLEVTGDDLRLRAQIIERTLESFNVPAQVVEANQGPAVTQFGVRPGTVVHRNRKGEEKRAKVRVAQIQALANDLSLALAASPIRIEAPVPGRDVVGVEVPNMQISTVSLRGVMESDEYRQLRGALPIGLGRDVSGQAVSSDLARMPHLLIAGATGSGKSVCVNAIISGLLLTHTPDSLRFLMIDPKRVELTVYNGIPHLIAPVVVDLERALPVLQWATREMDRRYGLFAEQGVRHIAGFNQKRSAQGEEGLPYIVILVDELADLMLSAPEDVERHVCRLAQLARATGIHLVIATQRPSVDVVTGLIKANFPARIAFAVTSQIDSRVILDVVGAEQLLGRGDMLFMAPDSSKLQRLQGCFVSDRETQALVNYWKARRPIEKPTDTPDAPDGAAETAADQPPNGQGPSGQSETGHALQPPLWPDFAEMAARPAAGDDMYEQAVAEVRVAGRASVSFLQRRLRIGYSRAAKLIDQMEASGLVGPDLGGSRGRELLSDGRTDRQADEHPE
jgi:DNA segregation ATPase FtsK/SpoIIIE, S-DNA-T family